MALRELAREMKEWPYADLSNDSRLSQIDESGARVPPRPAAAISSLGRSVHMLQPHNFSPTAAPPHDAAPQLQPHSRTTACTPVMTCHSRQSTPCMPDSCVAARCSS